MRKLKTYRCNYLAWGLVLLVVGESFVLPATLVRAQEVIPSVTTSLISSPMSTTSPLPTPAYVFTGFPELTVTPTPPYVFTGFPEPSYTPTPTPIVVPSTTNTPTGTLSPTNGPSPPFGSQPTGTTTPTPSPVAIPSLTPTVEPTLGAPQGSVGSARIRIPLSARRLAKKSYRIGEPIQVRVDNVADQEGDIHAVVVDRAGTKIQVTVEETLIDESKLIRITSRLSLKPGKYTLKVMEKDMVISQQDFTWGVLAINPNKATYGFGETADLAIAVLDENGSMVCDANVTLDITDPKGNVKQLSTSNSTITVNSECRSHNFTLRPDYETHIPKLEQGRYGLVLTAITKNGNYSISDAFTVDDSVPFDIERESGTRIYPPSAYPMRIKITARQDFTGSVIETVPQDFSVEQLPGVNEFADVAIVTETSTAVASASGQFMQVRYPFEGNYDVNLDFGSMLKDPLLISLYRQFGLKGHDGTDFDVPIGTPILAADDGEVVHAADQPYGNTVILQHSWGRSYYGHLSKFEVSVGDKVMKGDTLGLSGNTGLSTGPHLHFGIRLNNYDMQNGYYGKINPMPFLTASSAVISDVSVKKIRWDIAVKKGEMVTLGYSWKAPMESPQFYLMGPLRLRTAVETVVVTPTPTALPTVTATPTPTSSAAPVASGSAATVQPTAAIINPFALGIATSVGTQTEASGSAPTVTPTPEIVSTLESSPTPPATDSGMLDLDLFRSLLGSSGLSQAATPSATVAPSPEASATAQPETSPSAIFDAGSGASPSAQVFPQSADTVIFTEGRQWQIAADALFWYSGNWLYRKPITINHTRVTSDQTNFPVLINLSSDTDLAAHANSTGYDIVFASENGSTLLYHNLSKYTTATGALVAWVQIPMLSSTTDTVIYMYYGNPAITTDQSSTSTWDLNYVAVYHMNNSLNNYTSISGLNGTNHSTTNGTTSPIIGDYRNFVRASSQYVDVTPYNAAYDITGDITVSAWVKMTTVGIDAKVTGNQAGSSGQGGYKMGIYTNNKIEFEIRTSSNTPVLNRDVTGGTTLTTATWYYVVGHYSDTGNYLDTYVNGSLDRTLSTVDSLGTSTGTLKIGREPWTSDLYWNGNIDELRISNSIRPSTWISTEYNNQSSPSTFYTLGSEEGQGASLARLMRHGKWFNINGIEQPFTF